MRVKGQGTGGRRGASLRGPEWVGLCKSYREVVQFLGSHFPGYINSPCEFVGSFISFLEGLSGMGKEVRRIVEEVRGNAK